MRPPQHDSTRADQVRGVGGWHWHWLNPATEPCEVCSRVVSGLGPRTGCQAVCWSRSPLYPSPIPPSHWQTAPAADPCKTHSFVTGALWISTLRGMGGPRRFTQSAYPGGAGHETMYFTGVGGRGGLRDRRLVDEHSARDGGPRWTRAKCLSQRRRSRNHVFYRGRRQARSL